MPLTIPNFQTMSLGLDVFHLLDFEASEAIHFVIGICHRGGYRQIARTGTCRCAPY